MMKFLSSTRITVVCLFLLFILTFWGTIAQVQQGLYSAQERFFNSFYFLAAGFIPFPGAQLVLWVLFINLLCMFILSYKKFFQWSNLGNLIIHLGILLYFVAAFMVFHVSSESYIRFTEGQTTNVSNSYTDWEVAFWVDTNGKKREITAVDTKVFKPEYIIPTDTKDFSLTVKQYYSNSDAFSDGSGKKNPRILNEEGITLLTPKPILKEREQNVAGGVFNIKFDGKSYTLILYGIEVNPTEVMIAGKKYNFILRHKHFPLPFTLKLDHFKTEFYPGMDMAKSYESLVTISTGTLERQVRIYMNNPLRYNDYTVYQASYDADSTGRQYTTLAVVRNSARIMPYVSCLVVFFGLALHFLMQAFISRIKP
ncbi:MAG: cytochrome c biogenesis protein ResB [Candidatus Omnitrophica bacterium]|nr:cytochrome c biogenesis protein ResB [Candidatus Omnitrophota bacterium]